MTLDERVRAIERRLGTRLILRGVRDPDPLWRGRITTRPGYLLLEYRDATPGFFWHHDIIRELLDRVEQGPGDAVLRDESENAPAVRPE